VLYIYLNTSLHKQQNSEAWSLYEDDRRKTIATEMDALRQSARISKLGRTTAEFIRGKMDPQDNILVDMT
jgi:hypothetical protein